MFQLLHVNMTSKLKFYKRLVSLAQCTLLAHWRANVSEHIIWKACHASVFVIQNTVGDISALNLLSHSRVNESLGERNSSVNACLTLPYLQRRLSRRAHGCISIPGVPLICCIA